MFALEVEVCMFKEYGTFKVLEEPKYMLPPTPKSLVVLACPVSTDLPETYKLAVLTAEFATTALTYKLFVTLTVLVLTVVFACNTFT